MFVIRAEHMALSTKYDKTIKVFTPKCAYNTNKVTLCHSDSIMFYVCVFSSSTVNLLCQVKQMKMTDIHQFKLRGIIRSDKKSVDYLIPKSIRVRLSVKLYKLRKYFQFSPNLT